MPPWAREAEARILRNRPAPTDRFWADPARLLTDAGLQADPWQADLLRSTAGRVLLLCSRQAGKTTTAAALTLKTALLQPGSLCLILSPTLRQSSEMLRAKIKPLYNALGRPVPTVQESALTMEFKNGSRVVSLPGEEGTVRGYSGAKLIVLDEASRVSEALYEGVRPMLATVRDGRLVALSTPFGCRGWFWSEFTGGGDWLRVKVTADQCPRISKQFLDEERRALGERTYRQEYLCSFEANAGAMFAEEDIQAAFTDEVKPMQLGGVRCR